MLDTSLKDQLKNIFAVLEARYTLDIAVAPQHESWQELTEMLADVAECSDKISCQIKEGKASILSNIDGETVQEFEIEIQRVMKYGSENCKDMVIKITDEGLLEKTGGIVQGMSGSPIIQDGKLVGAVTHVFVNDPTRGYGIFIDNIVANLNAAAE